MPVPAMLTGALAGFVATVPMTAAMEVMHRQLPRDERYPLPPREISDQVTHKTGLREQLNEPEQTEFALASHFAFGTTAGAAYALVAKMYNPPPLAGGIAFGLAVWAASYLGVLPALGVLRPATEHPPRRTALMITAHVVWGAVTGAVVDRLQSHDT